MSRFKWIRRREAVEKAAEIAIVERLFPGEAAFAGVAITRGVTVVWLPSGWKKVSAL